jgi:uncharacterized protein
VTKLKHKLIGKSKDLENEIDLYLKCISKASLVFFEGTKEAFRGDFEDVEVRRQEISVIEKDADTHLKNIVYRLYSYNIVPDSRADVFELLDKLDDIVDNAKKILFHICVEKPNIPASLLEDFILLSKASVDAIDALLQGIRAFFEDINIIEQFVANVYSYEKKADRLEEALKRAIFQSGEVKKLSLKVQLRFFVEQMALLSDLSEEIAKNLLTYKIKRII